MSKVWGFIFVALVCSLAGFYSGVQFIGTAMAHDAIKAGVGRYVADPETGNVKFVYTRN